MNAFHRSSHLPVIIFGVTITLAGWGNAAFGVSNPFREIEALEAKTGIGAPAGLRQLMETARRLTLHGAARRMRGH